MKNNINTAFKQQMQEIMTTAWSFVKNNGFGMSEALQVAWRNYKLHQQLVTKIAKFYFQKVDGSIREAYGTLKADMLPLSDGESSRKPNPSVQVYWDTKKREFRCFKKANLLRIA